MSECFLEFTCVGCSNKQLSIIEDFDSKSRRKAGRKGKRIVLKSGYFDRFTLFKCWATRNNVYYYRHKPTDTRYIVMLWSSIHHFFKITA